MASGKEQDVDKLLGRAVDASTRKHVSGSLESWHWGNLRQSSPVAVGEESRLPSASAFTSENPSGSPHFGRSAIFQSGVFLPETETPGISPARGLGRTIHTSPLLASHRKANRQHSISQAQAVMPQPWGSPGDPPLSGPRASFYTIMRRRQACNLPAVSAARADSPSRSSILRSANEGAGKKPSENGLTGHPITFESSSENSQDSESPEGGESKGLAAQAGSNRPWSWSWAWTPPSLPSTPEERKSADFDRLSDKFKASSQAIAGSRSPTSWTSVTSRRSQAKQDSASAGSTATAQPQADRQAKDAAGLDPRQLSSKGSGSHSRATLAQPSGGGAEMGSGIGRASSDAPSFRDGIAPAANAKVVRFSLDEWRRSPKPAVRDSPQSAAKSPQPGWGRYAGSLSASIELRDADISRGRSLSTGGISPAPATATSSTGFASAREQTESLSLDQRVHHEPDDGTARSAAAESTANSGNRSVHGGDHSHAPTAVSSPRILTAEIRSSPLRTARTAFKAAAAAEDQPLSSHKSPTRIPSDARMTRSQQEAVQALWDSCTKAAAARQTADDSGSSGRTVRCSLLETMNSAASNGVSLGCSATNRRLNVPAEGVPRASLPRPHDSEVDDELDLIRMQHRQEQTNLERQLIEARRIQAALQEQISAIRLLGGGKSVDSNHDSATAAADGKPACSPKSSSIGSCSKTAAKPANPVEERAKQRTERERDGSAEGRIGIHSSKNRAGSPEPRVPEECCSENGRHPLNPDQRVSFGDSRHGESASQLDREGQLIAAAAAISDDSYGSWMQEMGAGPISKEDWTRERLSWRTRVRTAEGEAVRLRQRLQELEQKAPGPTVLEADGTQKSQDALAVQPTLVLEQQLEAKDWLLAQLQEQMQDSEEHFAKLLQEEHARLESCESEFLAAMREAEAQLAEAALAEEHLINELQLAHKELQDLQLENEKLREETGSGAPTRKNSGALSHSKTL